LAKASIVTKNYCIISTYYTIIIIIPYHSYKYNSLKEHLKGESDLKLNCKTAGPLCYIPQKVTLELEMRLAVSL